MPPINEILDWPIRNPMRLFVVGLVLLVVSDIASWHALMNAAETILLFMVFL